MVVRKRSLRASIMIVFVVSLCMSFVSIALLSNSAALAQVTFKLKVENNSSDTVTVFVRKTSDGSNAEKKVFKPGDNGRFTFKSSCNKDKTKKRSYIVYRGKYPSSSGNTIIGSGDFTIKAQESGGGSDKCLKGFSFANTKNNSGTGTTIKTKRNSETRGVLIFSDT